MRVDLVGGHCCAMLHKCLYNLMLLLLVSMHNENTSSTCSQLAV